MPGNLLQVGADGALRVGVDGTLIVAGAADPCCCASTNPCDGTCCLPTECIVEFGGRDDPAVSGVCITCCSRLTVTPASITFSLATNGPDDCYPGPNGVREFYAGSVATATRHTYACDGSECGPLCRTFSCDVDCKITVTRACDEIGCYFTYFIEIGFAHSCSQIDYEECGCGGGLGFGIGQGYYEYTPGSGVVAIPDLEPTYGPSTIEFR